MKRISFALLAATAIVSSTGCCCLENWLCRPWGCGHGGCGDCCDSCGGGYGGGCGGGCSSCGMSGGGGGQSMGGQQMYGARQRNSGGQMAYDDGPPTGAVTYPYYTNRGPRDFLARNPRSIGP